MHCGVLCEVEACAAVSFLTFLFDKTRSMYCTSLPNIADIFASKQTESRAGVSVPIAIEILFTPTYYVW